MPANLYIHFPFCRRKCSYCALHSRAGASSADRDAYARRLASEISALTHGASPLDTVYFGGGSPALCDLSPLAPALRPLCGEKTEFTVELHPLDATPETLSILEDLGVNRISMGVQSLDDAVLADMGRGYTVAEAERAFALVKGRFDNAGIDLIVGYPPPLAARGLSPIDKALQNLDRLKAWGLRHCSVYSLILEERTLLWKRTGGDRSRLPSDDVVLDQLAQIARFLKGIGLSRYEISNYAAAGFECRHNLAVWRGEDYLGLGEGAYGRVGLKRIANLRSGVSETAVTPQEDEKERRIFRLRTSEGLDATGHPEWDRTLGKFVQEGLLTKTGAIYRLTDRGTEVCDSILAELV